MKIIYDSNFEIREKLAVKAWEPKHRISRSAIFNSQIITIKAFSLLTRKNSGRFSHLIYTRVCMKSNKIKMCNFEMGICLKILGVCKKKSPQGRLFYTHKILLHARNFGIFWFPCKFFAWSEFMCKCPHVKNCV